MHQAWTNKFDLPAPIVAAIIDDDYSRGESEYSVTQLIDVPYRVAQVRRPAMADVEQDVSDRLYALEGKMLHHLLEHGVPKMDGPAAELVARLSPGMEHTQAEDRLFALDMGVKWSGQYDLYYQRNGDWWLEDHKRVSVNEFKVKRQEHHWEHQLNLLALLVRRHGGKVDRIAINCYYRDWSKAKAYYDRSGEYPPAQVQRLNLDLWPQEKQQEYLESRIRMHIMESNVPCTAEERWVSEEIWAVKMPGAARAMTGGLHKSLDAAEAFRHEQALKDPKKKAAIIEHREGGSLRCLLYCDAAKICPHWQSLTSGKYGGVIESS
jgi:hypothetical protein